MKTLLKIAQIIRADGTTARDCSIAIDGDGNVIEFVPNSQLSSFPVEDFTVEDESSCTLMPLLADSHVHLGISNGIHDSAHFHTSEIVDGQLSIYLQAGVGHVLSLGTDQPWVQELSRNLNAAKPQRGIAVPYSAGCGFGAVCGWPPELSGPQLRFRPTDTASAEENVRDLIGQGIRILKIWVDDLAGTVPSLPLPISKAIIDEAHRNGLKVCAHVFSERDARDLISLNIDALAHSIRDRRVGPAFANYMAERKVKLMPTLVREEAAVAFSCDENPYLADPFFVRCAGDMFDTVSAERSTFNPREADAFKRAFDLAVQNLACLSNAQIEICLGTDAGFRLKLPGFSQHRELQLMCEAGLTSSQALAAGLANNYGFFAQAASDLSIGQPADFVLLYGDPLADIRNTTRIRQVRRQGIIVG